MHAASLLAYLEIMKTINYVIELAKEQQAIVLGEVCMSPNCSQIATDPSQWPVWDMLYNFFKSLLVISGKKPKGCLGFVVCVSIYIECKLVCVFSSVSLTSSLNDLHHTSSIHLH
jgi:hypothetical protein